ncbi:coiled-coil domain-containing protein 158 [Discoglossus pictus]
MACRSIFALREQLQGQTREIQQLQKEVEHAMKCTLEKMSVPYHDRCSSRPITAKYESTTRANSTNAQMGDHTYIPPVSHHKTALQSSLPSSFQTSPVKSSLMSNCYWAPQQCCCADGKGQHVEKVLEDFSSQVKDSQRMLNQSSKLHEQQNHQIEDTINDLQGKIQNLKPKRENLMDTSHKDSESEEEASRHLQVTIHELQMENPVQEEMLKQSQVYNEHLKEILLKQEEVLKDIQACLVRYAERSGKNVFEQGHITSGPFGNLRSAVDKVLLDLGSEVSVLKNQHVLAEDQLEFMKRELKNKETLLIEHQERYNNVVTRHEQEVAALTDQCKHVRSQADTVQTQMENIQKQARDQSTKYEEQISNLESTMSELQSELRTAQRMYKDKVEELKGQLVNANSALIEARDEQTRYSQELRNLGDQLKQLSANLQKCEKDLSSEKEKNKQLRDRDAVNNLTNEHLRKQLFDSNMEAQRLQDQVTSLTEEKQRQAERQITTLQEKNASLEITTFQLESAKDLLHKTAEELGTKNRSLESAERTIENLKTCLEEKEEKFRNTIAELKKKRSYSEMHQLKKYKEQLQTMDLHLTEKNHMVKALQDKVDSMTRMVGEYSQKSSALQAERSKLLEEVREKKSEMQEMRTLSEKKDKRISELEASIRGMDLDKEKLALISSEKSLAAKELRVERDQLKIDLKATQRELANLAEEYDTLKRNYQNRHGETVSTTSMLKMQLRAAVAELEQTKNTLKTMEGCDGHAMKIAMGMQKKITAKRGQIDALQSRMQFLEEALSDATKDKHHLKGEKAKLTQELSREVAERQKLATELENLQSENITYKDNVASMESALEKASLQLSECQAAIQRLEQESMRLRLQHTLDLKELKGPTTAGTTKPTYTRGSDYPNLPLLQTAQCRPGSKHLIMEKPTRDIKQFAKEFFHGETAMQKSRMSEDFNKRSSILHATMNDFTKDTAEIRSKLDSYNRDPLTLHTADLEVKDNTAASTHTENVLWPNPRYTSSPKLYSKDINNRPRSPVHCLLTAPSSDMDIPSTSLTRTKETCRKDSASGDPSTEITSETCQKLQNRLDSLQTMAEDLQTKNKAMSSMIRKQRKGTVKSKKEKKCSK